MSHKKEEFFVRRQIHLIGIQIHQHTLQLYTLLIDIGIQLYLYTLLHHFHVQDLITQMLQDIKVVTCILSDVPNPVVSRVVSWGEKGVFRKGQKYGVDGDEYGLWSLDGCGRIKASRIKICDSWLEQRMRFRIKYQTHQINYDIRNKLVLGVSSI